MLFFFLKKQGEKKKANPQTRGLPTFEEVEKVTEEDSKLNKISALSI